MRHHMAFLCELAACPDEKSPRFHAVGAGYLILRLCGHWHEYGTWPDLQEEIGAIAPHLACLPAGEGRQLLEAIGASLLDTGRDQPTVTLRLLLDYATWLEAQGCDTLALDVLQTAAEEFGLDANAALDLVMSARHRIDTLVARLDLCGCDQRPIRRQTIRSISETRVRFPPWSAS